MHSHRSSKSVAIGLATLGLALAVAGVWLYRRNKARDKAGRPGSEMQGGTHKNMHANASQEKLPLGYFGLVFAISVPFWLVGGSKLPLPVNLPVSALQALNPCIAASILLYRRHGSDGVKDLFKKAFDYKNIKNGIWYVPILLLSPAIFSLSYLVKRLRGLPLPDDPRVPLRLAPAFFLVFLIPAMGEELGWMGYAIEPMQNRWGAFKASVVLGFVWAIWHLIGFVQTGNTARWIIWHSLGTVALRVLIVWIYNHTGKSVGATILFHDMNNVSWSLFPNYGSHYDPFVTTTITWLTAAIAYLLFPPPREKQKAM